MEDKPKVNLIFYSITTDIMQIHSYKFSFEKKEVDKHLVTNLEHLYPIPEEVFEFGEDKALISINLYDSFDKVIKEIKFEVNYCYNNVYIGKENSKSGYNFELDFKNAIDLKVHYNNLQFNIFDSVNTNDRKKITMLNYNNFFILANTTEIKIKDLIEECKEKSFFYRFSMNLIGENPKIIVQPIKDFYKPDLHLLMKQESFIKIFYDSLLELMEKDFDSDSDSDSGYKGFHKRIYNIYTLNITPIQYGLNTSKKYLDKYFKEHNIDLQIVFKYIIFEIFKKGEEKYLNNKELLKNIILKMEKVYDEINVKNDKTLTIYDKIILLKGISNTYLSCNDLDELNSIDIKYFIFSKCEKNSIMDKTKIMFNKFLSNLTERSKIFTYLLNINAGIGYYKNEPVYTFDMTNISMMRKHLEDLFPKFLIFYHLENDELAETYKTLGWVTINLLNLEKYKEKEIKCSFDKDLKDEDLSNDLAIDMFNIILHEVTGHKKFTYKINNSESPQKIINEKNELVKLKSIINYKVYKKDKGESGSFAELGLGNYKKTLITSIMYKLDNKGKLFFNPKLFTSEEGDILKKYIILKTYIKENPNKNVNITKDMTIYEEIKEMEKYVNYQELIAEDNEDQVDEEDEKEEEEEEEKEKEIKISGKKKKRCKEDNDDYDKTFYKIKNINYEDKKKIELFNREKGEDSEGKKDNEGKESKNIKNKNEEMNIENLYKYVVQKYGFEHYNIIPKIAEKLKDKNLDKNERKKLDFVLDNLLHVS